MKKRDIISLLERRNAFCRARDFAEADRTRDLLAAQAATLEEGPVGIRWRYGS